MSNLNKQDFDDYLGKEEFFTDIDKERFYKNVSSSKGWKMYRIPQTLTIAVLIGLFVVGVQFFQGNMPLTSSEEDEELIDSPTTDWSNWIEAESTKDVQEFYETVVPGLRIAKELDQVVNVNNKYSLGNQINLYIDHVWYHENKVYLFYSMDLSDEAFVRDNEDTGIITDFILQGEQELTASNPSHLSGAVFDDTFNNKLYRVAVITLEEEQQLVDMNKVTASFTIDAHNDEVTVPEIHLPVSYGEAIITSNNINVTTQTPNSTITIERFDQGDHKGYLYGNVDSALGQEVNYLGGKITTENGNEFTIGDLLVDSYQGTFVIDIPELISQDISIEFDHLLMTENKDTIDIPIDVSNYEEVLSDEPIEKMLHQKVDEIANTSIYLRSILFDDQGVMIGISTEQIDPDNPAYFDISTGSLLHEKSGFVFPNMIRAVDNNGKEAENYDFLSSDKEIGSEIRRFGFSKNYIKDKENIVVSITNLSIGEHLNWSVAIQNED